jgi:hypothetical protein
MTAPYAVVPGEEELGVQKRCPQCGDWWPAMDPTWWQQSRNGSWHAWCKDCLISAKWRRGKRPAPAYLGDAA